MSLKSIPRRIILVDMDDTTFEMEKIFLERYKNKYPDLPFIPFEERRTFKLTDQYPKELHAAVRSIYHAPGFYADLPPIPGAIEALQELAEQHDVFLCSRPLRNYAHCLAEKYACIEKHLGKDWMDRTILTRDKTLIRGDVLIDDNPSIAGLVVPSWEHVLFTRPWNQYETSKRRIENWEEWKDALYVQS
jgi:5'-nucleotidase